MENVVTDSESSTLAPSIRLKNPINLNDIVGNKGSSFELELDDFNQNVEQEEQLSYDSREVHKYLNMDCLDLDSSTCYEGNPFEGIKRKMINVTEDGKVMKLVLREGVGELLDDMSYVTIHYNSYFEHNDEPFDSTYIRKSPHKFRLNNGDILPGLNAAVATMKRTEKSQFLVHPDYAYGANGCFERVPKNATILYEVEVLQCTDQLPATDKSNFDPDNMNFQEVLKMVKQLIANANAIIERSGNYRAAIREYNQAASRLEMAKLIDYDEQQEQSKNLLRLYTNLAISYNRVQNPQRACINCDKVYRLVKGTSLVAPAKLYYNHAKALMNLNEFKRAEQKLRKASSVAQSNTDIVRLYLKLNKMIEENDEREKTLAKAMIGQNKEASDELKDIVRTLCEELKDDDEKVQYNLPDKLSEVELTFIKDTAKEYGFILIRTPEDKDGIYKYKLSKVISETGE